MKRLILLACLLMVGCNGTLTIEFGGSVPPGVVSKPDVHYPGFQEEFPTVNLIEALRQENWLGREGEGSCVHATMIMLLRWQGRDELADYWKHTYENGEWPEGLADKCGREGIRFAYTSEEKDVSFLEWAIRTRRGCGVTCMDGAHMVLLVHLDSEKAGILDNNHPGEIKWMSRQEFLSEWMTSRSWAVTPVYTPPTPLPCESTQCDTF